MAITNLMNELQTLSLSEAPLLLFTPNEDCPWLSRNLDDVPCYLFLVVTPLSDGTTDALWAKSKDARYNRPHSATDVLARKDKCAVARMLSRHLRWKGKSHDPDNLNSWTSSLMFALQYMFYRHYSSRDGSTMANIRLCVVDTAAFPKGVFIRDMDLIHVFRSFDQDLQNLEGLRTRQHRDLTGSYYFGEYLSQGALKIENKCQIVSAQAIIGAGLFSIMPEFSETLPAENTPWAKKVIELREAFYQSDSTGITEDGIHAAIAIAELFGGAWRLPLAANLMALLPSRGEERTILETFVNAPFTADDKANCSPSRIKLMNNDLLPEVQRSATIMKMVYEEFCLNKLKNILGEVEANLRGAISVARDKNLNLSSLSTPAVTSTSNSSLAVASLCGAPIILMAHIAAPKTQMTDEVNNGLTTADEVHEDNGWSHVQEFFLRGHYTKPPV